MKVVTTVSLLLLCITCDCSRDAWERLDASRRNISSSEPIHPPSLRRDDGYREIRHERRPQATTIGDALSLILNSIHPGAEFPLNDDYRGGTGEVYGEWNDIYGEDNEDSDSDISDEEVEAMYMELIQNLGLDNDRTPPNDYPIAHSDEESDEEVEDNVNNGGEHEDPPMSNTDHSMVSGTVALPDPEATTSDETNEEFVDARESFSDDDMPITFGTIRAITLSLSNPNDREINILKGEYNGMYEREFSPKVDGTITSIKEYTTTVWRAMMSEKCQLVRYYRRDDNALLSLQITRSNVTYNKFLEKDGEWNGIMEKAFATKLEQMRNGEKNEGEPHPSTTDEPTEDNVETTLESQPEDGPIVAQAAPKVTMDGSSKGVTMNDDFERDGITTPDDFAESTTDHSGAHSDDPAENGENREPINFIPYIDDAPQSHQHSNYGGIDSQEVTVTGDQPEGTPAISGDTTTSPTNSSGQLITHLRPQNTEQMADILARTLADILDERDLQVIIRDKEGHPVPENISRTFSVPPNPVLLNILEPKEDDINVMIMGDNGMMERVFTPIGDKNIVSVEEGGMIIWSGGTYGFCRVVRHYEKGDAAIVSIEVSRHNRREKIFFEKAPLTWLDISEDVFNTKLELMRSPNQTVEV